jgi:uncharacterized repeat protein (TIGR01451 family)
MNRRIFSLMGNRATLAAGLVAAVALMLPASALATSNLSIDQTLDEPDPVVQGSNVTYTLEVKNTGPDAAANVSVRSYVPAGTAAVAFGQQSGPAFSLAFNGTEFTANAASLASGTTAVFKAVYTANTPDTIWHKAQVTTSGSDPDLANNEDLEATTVLPRGLSLTIADTKDPIQPGENIEYLLSVQNRGGNTASNVTLKDTLPPQTKFVSLSGPAGWTLTTPPVGGTGPIFATNSSVASGTVHTFTLVVNAPSVGLMENPGQVSGTVVDGDALDNYDTELTTVAEPALPQGPITSTTPTTPAPTCRGKRATIVGTGGADDLRGTRGADVIAALAGKDKVRGRGGSDLICGGSGGDTLLGGAGDDRLVGGPNRDTCVGGAGKDRGGCEQRRSF